MRAKRVGAERVGGSSYVGVSRVGRSCGIAYRRITVFVSLAALLGCVLYGLERLRCPPFAEAVDALRAYGCFPAASGCRRC